METGKPDTWYIYEAANVTGSRDWKNTRRDNRISWVVSERQPYLSVDSRRRMCVCTSIGGCKWNSATQSTRMAKRAQNVNILRDRILNTVKCKHTQLLIQADIVLADVGIYYPLTRDGSAKLSSFRRCKNIFQKFPHPPSSGRDSLCKSSLFVVLAKTISNSSTCFNRWFFISHIDSF